MNLITPTILHDLGIHKSAAVEAELIEHFHETLNERVGASILDVLTDEQAAKLIELNQAGDGGQTTAWLLEALPEYDQIIQNEYDILMGELAEHADYL